MFLHIFKVSINACQAGLFSRFCQETVDFKKKWSQNKKKYFLAGTLEISLETDLGSRGF